MSARTRSPDARRARRCRSKATFASRGAAQNAARKYAIHNKTALRPYFCDICGKWHNTKSDGGGFWIVMIILLGLAIAAIKAHG